MVKIKREVDVNTYFDVDVEIDVQDFYSELSNDEIYELIDLLVQDQYILDGPNIRKYNTHMDDKWRDSVSKLFSNRWKLSNEDIETIEKIADKL